MERVVFLVAFCLLHMSNSVEVPKYKLNNGFEMPAIALGTYLGFDQGPIKSKNKEVRDAIVKAIDIGWRHIDTAAIYENEEEIGEGLSMKIGDGDGKVNRESIFITAKLWNTHHKREKVAEALRSTLKKLNLDYVDLYLIHWPMGLNEDQTHSDVDYIETWRGMEDIQKLGLARSIGVSNFNKEQLGRLLKEANVKPAALQIEVHPQIIQTELVSYAQENGLIVMGYSPFGSLVSRFGMMFPGPRVDDPQLKSIAKKYGKTVPQIFLRWLVERKVVPIPKTTKESRLRENINVFDFSLGKDEMDVINSYDSNKRFTLPSFWQTHPYYPFEKTDQPIDNPFVKKDQVVPEKE